MLDLLERFHLGLFGEGEGADAAEGGEDAGEEIPGSVPARARENYRKALKAGKKTEDETPEEKPEEEAQEATHLPYADLIRSDEYREEHKAYMDKTLADRLKKYKGIEDVNAKQLSLLQMVAQKYGLDSQSEGFLDELRTKIDADDSYYEKYAVEHDISPQEARRIVTLENRVKEQDAREKARQEEEARRQRWQTLYKNAEQTKAAYPDFDFEREWQNPKFVELTARLGGDVMTAYKVAHFNELQKNAVMQVSQQVARQTVNAVKANKARPIENGIGGSVASQTVAQDFSKMNLSELRAWADEQRRTRR